MLYLRKIIYSIYFYISLLVVFTSSFDSNLNLKFVLNGNCSNSNVVNNLILTAFNDRFFKVVKECIDGC